MTGYIDMDRYNELVRTDPNFVEWRDTNMPALNECFRIEPIDETLTRWTGEGYDFDADKLARALGDSLDEIPTRVIEVATTPADPKWLVTTP